MLTAVVTATQLAEHLGSAWVILAMARVLATTLGISGGGGGGGGDGEGKIKLRKVVGSDIPLKQCAPSIEVLMMAPLAAR